MSKQEMTSGASAPIVVVEQTASSRHKSYRPTELQEEASPELHKRSRAPAAPSVIEDLKDTAVAKEITENSIERVDDERAISTEKQSHHAKKLSSSKRRGSSPEEIAMVLMDAQKDTVVTVPQPIPDHDTVLSKRSTHKVAEKTDEDTKEDEDSITEEIAELRTAEPAKEHSGWSDDEEAGGLPRSESRGSRVSRVMRQLFCCGVAYSPASEEEIAERQESSGI